jgi:hypothetical protein
VGGEERDIHDEFRGKQGRTSFDCGRGDDTTTTNNGQEINAMSKKYHNIDQTDLINIYLKCYSIATRGHLASFVLYEFYTYVQQ